MAAHFHQFAVIYDDNFVGVANRGQTVGNDKDRTIGHQVVDRLLNDCLRLVIQSGGRLVQNNNRRIFDKGTGNGNTLFLTAGEQNAALADFGIQSFIQRSNKLFQAG